MGAGKDAVYALRKVSEERIGELIDALIDPNLGQAEGTGLSPTGFEGWLGQFGVRLGSDIVVDPPNDDTCEIC